MLYSSAEQHYVPKGNTTVVYTQNFSKWVGLLLSVLTTIKK